MVSDKCDIILFIISNDFIFPCKLGSFALNFVAPCGVGVCVWLVGVYCTVAMHAYDAVTRRAVMRNVDTRPRRFVDGDNVAMSCAYNAEELSPPTTASVPDTPETPAESGASTLGRGNGKGSGKGNNWKDALVGNSKVIQKASSMTMDFEAAAAPFHLLQLSGR